MQGIFKDRPRVNEPTNHFRKMLLLDSKKYIRDLWKTEFAVISGNLDLIRVQTTLHHLVTVDSTCIRRKNANSLSRDRAY